MRDKSGFRKLIVWQNAKKIRRMVYVLSERFPKAELRRVSQMRDAARSVKQNIQEGFKRGSTGVYIHFLVISKGSLSELAGDIDDCLEDGLISKKEYSRLDELIGKTDYLFMRLISALGKKRNLKS